MTLMQNPSHPGEVLAELYLEPLGMSAIDLARRLHVPRTRVERLVKGDTALTVDTGDTALEVLRQHAGVLDEPAALVRPSPEPGNRSTSRTSSPWRLPDGGHESRGCRKTGATLIKYWPYNLDLTLANYDFDRVDDTGWRAYTNSLTLAVWTMIAGTFVVFSGAYLVEKTRRFALVRNVVHLLSMIPLAVPGLVLGISYILFFNDPGNPFIFLFGTMAILVVSTVIHYYPVSHLISVTR